MYLDTTWRTRTQGCRQLSPRLGPEATQTLLTSICPHTRGTSKHCHHTLEKQARSCPGPGSPAPGSFLGLFKPCLGCGKFCNSTFTSAQGKDPTSFSVLNTAYGAP